MNPKEGIYYFAEGFSTGLLGGSVAMMMLVGFVGNMTYNFVIVGMAYIGACIAYFNKRCD
jgi:mannose/fructose/N-acetylgalactosamine-specific phosphotransferase system component IIC